MITLEKGTIEYIYVPVEIFGALESELPGLTYEMAFPALDAQSFAFIGAEYLPNTKEVLCLLDTGNMEKGEYRMKVRVTDDEERPLKDVGKLVLT